MAYDEIFQQVAQKYGLDWRLMVEQCFRESRFDPLAVGAASDMGLMQIVPATWDEWATKIGVYDPFDPESNITVAGAYLAWIRDQLAKAGRLEPYWMLAAYNWGIGNVLTLLKSGGGWKDVPERAPRLCHRHYPGHRGQHLAAQIAPEKPAVHGV